MRAVLAVYGTFISLLAGLSVYQFYSLPPADKPVLPTPFFSTQNDSELKLGEPSFIYRGSHTRTGTEWDQKISDSLREDWIFEPLNVRIHSASKASPAIDESGVYIGTDTNWFYAFDHQGRMKWRFYSGQQNSQGFHATASLDDKHVYIGDYKGGFFAFAKDTGKVVWSLSFRKAGTGSSPVLYKGSLYVAVEEWGPYESYVIKLDPQNGKIEWSSPRLGEQTHSSVVIDEESGTILLGANNDKLFGINLADGTIKWERLMDGKIKSTLALVEGDVFVSTWGQRLHRVKASTGDVIWSAPLKGTSQSSPSWVPEHDLIVLGDHAGRVWAFDRQSGKVKWTHEANTWGLHAMAPMVARTTTSGHEWRVWTVCARKTICALDAGTGRQMNALKINGFFSGMPIAYGGSLFVALDTGGLMKFSPREQRLALAKPVR